MSMMAEAVGITPHKLSSLLNNHYQVNFVDFINTYRINSIKEQMTLPQNMQHYTIESMAYEAGFSSRSAFYNAFKKLMGTSPAEFVRSQNNN
jgi:AraC-like DNA-binding protein